MHKFKVEVSGNISMCYLLKFFMFGILAIGILFV